MDEIFKKFPDLIKMLLEKISQSGNSQVVSNEAKQRLLSKLQAITEEISVLQNQQGEKLTEEQIQKIKENK